MNSACDVILGMPFLTDINPLIAWNLKHWKTLDMIFPKACEHENRNVFLNFISANKMARSIKKDKNPSTKYFLAELKKEYDLVELNALNEICHLIFVLIIFNKSIQILDPISLNKREKNLKNTLTF